MRNLLALVGAAVVTVGGVGWYLDWFKVHKAAEGDGKKSYSVEVNTAKIGTDLHKGSSKVQSVIDEKFPKKEAQSNKSFVPMPPAFDGGEGIALPVIKTKPVSVEVHTETPSGPDLTPPMPMPPPN